MSQVCPHGFSPSECLICRTLGTKPQVQVETGRGAPARAPDGRQEPARPDQVYPPDTPRPGRSLTSYAVFGVAGLIVVVVAAWLVAGIVVGLLHALELVIVAAVVGWACYRIGHYRGRRQRP